MKSRSSFFVAPARSLYLTRESLAGGCDPSRRLFLSSMPRGGKAAFDERGKLTATGFLSPRAVIVADLIRRCTQDVPLVGSARAPSRDMSPTRPQLGDKHPLMSSLFSTVCWHLNSPCRSRRDYEEPALLAHLPPPSWSERC